jgi:hypothetical protein
VETARVMELYAPAGAGGQERPDRVRDTEQLFGFIAPVAMAKALPPLAQRIAEISKTSRSTFPTISWYASSR